MIELDPEGTNLFSIFTDEELLAIEEIFGPVVKSAFLTPWPVTIQVEPCSLSG